MDVLDIVYSVSLSAKPTVYEGIEGHSCIDAGIVSIISAAEPWDVVNSKP